MPGYYISKIYSELNSEDWKLIENHPYEVTMHKTIDLEKLPGRENKETPKSNPTNKQKNIENKIN